MRSYLLNSKLYGSWGSNFEVYLHNENGYKYNCSFMEEVANTTLNCLYDLKNTSFISSLG